MNTEEFATEDMKSVVDKILKIMQESPDHKESSQISRSSHTPELKPKKSPASETNKSLVPPKFEIIYSRMQAYQEKHNQELKKIKEKSEENHRLIHTHTPALTERTRKMAGNVSPLHDRYKLEANLKDQRRKELILKSKKTKEEEMKKELTFQPKTSKSFTNVRTAEEYYNYMKS